MKKLTMTLFCAIATSLTACATPPTAKMTLHIRDTETGEPLGNVEVRTQFRPAPNKRLVAETKRTDANGICIVEGLIDYVCISSGLKKKGYYGQIAQLNFKGRNRILNRWEPWNPTIEVRMRKKKNPVPMVAKRIEWKQIPEMGESIGYDLEVGDWTAPHGKGKIADFTLTATGYFQDPQKGSEGRYILSFSNETDGIQAYRFPDGTNSSFKWPYEAPLDEYQSSMEKFKHWDLNGMPDKTNYNDKNNYIFRVRSRKLEDGSIVGCYGMIQRELQVLPRGKVKFEYWVNPVPNERSLEYSGENLLKK